MNKIGLFYGTDTGNTEMVANKLIEKIEAILGSDSVDLFEIYQKKAEDMNAYDLIIMGQPTWYDGELQGDWEEFIPELKKIDFSNKKVAFFGLGDQYGYASYFCDSLGVFADMVMEQGGQIVGYTSTEGYEHDFSKAEKDGQFCGLCLDEDNQDELTEERLENWLPKVLKEFGLK
ncbi:MAG: flavodoxin [Chitinophagales bacterium]|nr:flavodoxin [Chitinophagales bacterium]